MDTVPLWFAVASWIVCPLVAIWFARQAYLGRVDAFIVAGLCWTAATRGLFWIAEIVAGVVWPA